MRIGTQYYRAPFPERRFWAEDFRRIYDSGLDTVQLWVLWAWVESTPDEFVYDDYDELVELAEKQGLGVVLSTVAEIQPAWIHRVVSDCELVARDGRKFISIHRPEVNFGLTPGGCTDHPQVWERMSRFLGTTVRRYAGAGALVGWDAWNELRWKEGADPYGMLPCYCPHTLAAFREWLAEQYGSLDALNHAWKRRYVAWEDVQPARVGREPYSHGMAWQRFITERSNSHGIERYRLMKAIDPVHPITLHPPGPCTEYVGGPHGYALERGNDWDFADAVDGIGVSHFPRTRVKGPSNWAMLLDRIRQTQSAARSKPFWMSELQGGRAASAFGLQDSVEPADQQRWVWISKALGADMLLFWCWRDEVFGKESAGYGISGNDGYAGARLTAMRRTSDIMQKHSDLLRTYRPYRGAVGVWFSPQTYYLEWAEKTCADRAAVSRDVWQAALTRACVPYRTVEERHLDELAELSLLILPRTLVLGLETERVLEAWVRAGGTLVCESETGAFGVDGFYRYPDERWLAGLTGAVEVGRRRLASEAIPVELPGGGSVELHGSDWRTPMSVAGNVWASDSDGALVQEVAVDKGRVLLCGSYFGARAEGWSDAFVSFARTLTERAGVVAPARMIALSDRDWDFSYSVNGRAGDRDVLFCFTPAGLAEARVELSAGMFAEGRAYDIIGERAAKIDGCILTFEPDPWGIAVFVSAEKG